MAAKSTSLLPANPPKPKDASSIHNQLWCSKKLHPRPTDKNKPNALLTSSTPVCLPIIVPTPPGVDSTRSGDIGGVYYPSSHQASPLKRFDVVSMGNTIQYYASGSPEAWKKFLKQVARVDSETHGLLASIVVEQKPDGVRADSGPDKLKQSDLVDRMDGPEDCDDSRPEFESSLKSDQGMPATVSSRQGPAPPAGDDGMSAKLGSDESSLPENNSSKTVSREPQFKRVMTCEATGPSNRPTSEPQGAGPARAGSSAAERAPADGRGDAASSEGSETEQRVPTQSRRGRAITEDQPSGLRTQHRTSYAGEQEGLLASRDPIGATPSGNPARDGGTSGSVQPCVSTLPRDELVFPLSADMDESQAQFLEHAIPSLLSLRQQIIQESQAQFLERAIPSLLTLRQLPVPTQFRKVISDAGTRGASSTSSRDSRVWQGSDTDGDLHQQVMQALAGLDALGTVISSCEQAVGVLDSAMEEFGRQLDARQLPHSASPMGNIRKMLAEYNSELVWCLTTVKKWSQCSLSDMFKVNKEASKEELRLLKENEAAKRQLMDVRSDLRALEVYALSSRIDHMSPMGDVGSTQRYPARLLLNATCQSTTICLGAGVVHLYRINLPPSVTTLHLKLDVTAIDEHEEAAVVASVQMHQPPSGGDGNVLRAFEVPACCGVRTMEVSQPMLGTGGACFIAVCAAAEPSLDAVETDDEAFADDEDHEDEVQAAKDQKAQRLIRRAEELLMKCSEYRLCPPDGSASPTTAPRTRYTLGANYQDKHFWGEPGDVGDRIPPLPPPPPTGDAFAFSQGSQRGNSRDGAPGTAGKGHPSGSSEGQRNTFGRSQMQNFQGVYGAPVSLPFAPIGSAQETRRGSFAQWNSRTSHSGRRNSGSNVPVVTAEGETQTVETGKAFSKVSSSKSIGCMSPNLCFGDFAEFLTRGDSAVGFRSWPQSLMVQTVWQVLHDKMMHSRSPPPGEERWGSVGALCYRLFLRQLSVSGLCHRALRAFVLSLVELQDPLTRAADLGPPWIDEGGSSPRSPANANTRLRPPDQKQLDHRQSCLLYLFGRLTGLFTNESRSFRRLLGDFIGGALDVICSLPSDQYGAVDWAGGEPKVSMRRAVAAVQTILGDDPAKSTHLNGIKCELHKFEATRTGGVGANASDSSSHVPLDYLLYMLVSEWQGFHRHLRASIQRSLHQATVPHEEILSIHDFGAALRRVIGDAVNPLTASELVILYCDGLDRSKSDTVLSSEAFVDLVVSHRLLQRGVVVTSDETSNDSVSDSQQGRGLAEWDALVRTPPSEPLWRSMFSYIVEGVRRWIEVDQLDVLEAGDGDDGVGSHPKRLLQEDLWAMAVPAGNTSQEQRAVAWRTLLGVARKTAQVWREAHSSPFASEGTSTSGLEGQLREAVVEFEANLNRLDDELEGDCLSERGAVLVELSGKLRVSMKDALGWLDIPKPGNQADEVSSAVEAR